MSDREQRVDLAAAHRLAVRFMLNVGLSNHFSARLESNPDCFLITPLGLPWSEVCASNLLISDGAGQIIGGEGEIDPSALFIHSSIFRARRDVSCILHTHQRFATTIAMLEGGRLLPASQIALRFHGRIAYEDVYLGASDHAREGERLAASLGDKAVLFHANHGVIVAGDSVARAFNDLLFLEQASDLQVRAQATGEVLRLIPDDVADRYVSDARHNSIRKQARRHFTVLKRVLDREEPGYAQ